MHTLSLLLELNRRADPDFEDNVKPTYTVQYELTMKV